MALLSMRAQVDEEILQVRDDWYKATIGLNVTITALEGLAATFGTTAELLELTGDALVEAFPRSVGTSPDVTSAARAAVKFNMTGGYLSSVITAVTLSQSAEAIERSKEIVELHNELVIDRLDRSVELRGMLYDVEELLVNEGVTRLKMFAVREQLRGLLDEYRSTLQEGIRLIEERRHVNAQIAAETQSNRYHDVLFRSARHESIERYRALYDITERYCYLAAKAFDYETNFDPRDRASAQPLLGEIARTRLLGQIADTLPVAGPGLAGLMAKLWDNFRAVEGRLGFNNFQIDTTEFSYRAEKSQVTTGPAWRAVLQEARRADLWEVPEFRRFCRPFAARGEPQPGIVLTFPTQVIAGKNFFGNDLGGGHSAYDPTVFATKIRAVGIRFDGYPIETLARTPYVYLIPAGLDYMTIPDSPTLETRAWNVVDQAIPVPHATSPQDLARVGWTATLDSLTGTWGEIRRFSSFRAGVDAATEMPLNATHFIGRSIWNDNWVLIIPGQTLHADPETGIAEFIENVTDIRFNFETYGYSGN
ncbi:MAG TPA: hypothetical protein DCE44_18740 [Verrucomicrobiales bacterium]|nr:hypothetical protein [Verrucomicrobiales bacterium]